MSSTLNNQNSKTPKYVLSAEHMTPTRDTHPGRLCADWLVVVEGGGIQHLREEGNQVAEDQMLPAASVSHIQ